MDHYSYDDLPPDNKNDDKKISEPMTNVVIEVNPHKNMSENLKTVVMEQSIDRVHSFCGSTDIKSEGSKHRPQPKNIAQAERDQENAGFEKRALTSSREARSGKRIL